MTFASAFTKSRSLRVDALDVHVGEAGVGPDVVLLHGNPDTHSVWSGVVARLVDRHHCIAPDLPGYGATPAPASLTFALDEQATFVRELLDALGLDRVHLVVHDVGGTYGLTFAALHPERLRSLTIFNCNLFPDYRWHFWARVWRQRGLGELAMAIMNRPLFVRELRRGSPRVPRDYVDHAYNAVTPATKRAVLRWYRAMDPEVLVGWDTRFLNATAAIHKQVVWGDLDPFLPAKLADRFGGEVQHVTDCGHWVMLEDPERSATAIASLVESAR